MKLTLDPNCIIDLEENRPAAAHLRELMAMHSAGVLHLAVVGISASENLPGGGSAPTFAAFQEKAARVGLADAEILKPMGIWGVTYWDWGLWGDNAMEELARQIHAVLFPDSDYDYVEYCAQRGTVVNENSIDPRWRNQLCDVLALWSHVYYRRDLFVTRDTNFLASAKRQALSALGVGTMCSPSKAVATVRRDPAP